MLALAELDVTEEYLEQLAERIALGNNGGTWAEHYTEDQKGHWRRLAMDLIDDVARHMKKSATK